MKYRQASSAAGRLRFYKGLTVSLILVLFLSGCMYPKEDQQENQVSYRESVRRIQDAVNDFYKEESILPIITAGEEVPRYEKYRVDLDKLKNMGYIDEIPKTAFEKGGSGHFLIINEEVDPLVKVMDLLTIQKVNDVQLSVNRYKSDHDGELPTGVELHPGFFSVDVAKTDMKKLQLKSFYSGQEITLMMDDTGKVYVDYAFDIMQAIQKNGEDPKPDQDLRTYLEEESYFVPVKSVPYLWVDQQPVAQQSE
ncbi:hypothetical protein [Paenibacillus lemnae]|uniref:DUF3939 domain-containing protein n=1 Tax=Paenibacillus lemnae TaxID=1330551 RepID=A0A848MAJ9_PAELE|nr:hypothetical protein [Paenibacillus lemnae]NMO96963.1 hypothetical protein [Paenibacillus lemnae]